MSTDFSTSTDFSLKGVVKATWKIVKFAGPLNRPLFWTILFTMVASIFQILGLGLVVPVLNGLVDPNHYEALLKTERFKPLVELSPFELTNRNIFLFMVSLVLLSSYLENLFLYLGQKTSAKLYNTVTHRLRTRVFQRYLGFSKSFFDQSNLGELNVILTTIITRVGQHFHFVCQMIVVVSFSLAFLFLMLMISWRLTILAFILLPLTHFTSSWLSQKLKKSAEGEAGGMVEVSERSLDVLNNVSLVQLAGTEELEVSRVEESSAKVRDHGTVARARSFLIPRVVDVINTTGIMALACGAVFLFFKGEAASIGRLAAFFISLRRFTGHVELMLATWSNCLGTAPYLFRVLWAFDDSDKSFVEDKGSKEFISINDDISFDNVRFSYKEGEPIIRKVSFEMKPGTMTAIVGPTGSGKTTLLNLIPRFLDRDSGSIQIDGVDIRDFKLSTLRNKIAIVSQNTFLFQDTIRNNLSYGLDPITDEEIFEALKKARIDNRVNELEQGLDTKIGKDGVQFSGGERQRLSIARAILRDPEILLLDEATSALDAETESEIQVAIDKLVEDRTVLVIAHRLATIRKANQVIVLENGKIVEQGSPQELHDLQGVFHRYCELQRIFH